ncbi:uncharacterized protein TNIN_233251 [Trichonephila inaurata madagascariensis]|uniref:Uncharacterized protein n=1 Tax=Trichonephila inaurata madagascariensis TaxID=2747483 RepID=A0A8X7CE37_9ARAC|nr:uncharacterized protein TNIN_233251 [Trichonephila inaurata madagascariensis]
MMSPLQKRKVTTCIPHQAAHNNEARYMPEMVRDRNHRKYTSLRPCINPVEGLPGFHFHTELLSFTNKNSDVPEYPRQLALEVVNGIPSDAILIYTEGSKDESNRTGSGAFIE